MEVVVQRPPKRAGAWWLVGIGCALLCFAGALGLHSLVVRARRWNDVRVPVRLRPGETASGTLVTEREGWYWLHLEIPIEGPEDVRSGLDLPVVDVPPPEGLDAWGEVSSGGRALAEGRTSMRLSVSSGCHSVSVELCTLDVEEGREYRIRARIDAVDPRLRDRTATLRFEPHPWRSFAPDLRAGLGLALAGFLGIPGLILLLDGIVAFRRLSRPPDPSRDLWNRPS